MRRRKLEPTKQQLSSLPPEPREKTRGLEGGQPVAVIVKVKEPGYVPEGFRVRSRIDACLFTADATPQGLEAAEHDPRVESIAAAERLEPPR